jgi:hypothetical protein
VICYLNRGFISEQAICALVEDYLNTLKVNEIYKNNQVHVALNNHFAKLYREQGERAADSFPAVVISSFDDDKNPDLNMLRPQTQGAEAALIGYEKSDIDKILDIYEPELVNGKKVKKPGICTVASDDVVTAIYSRLEKKDMVYGYSIRVYRCETISIDTWAENLQLKNELYEQIRLFVLGDLRNKLTEKYQFFDPRIDDDSVKGQRVLPFLMDFGLTLAGGNVQFEITYAIEQNCLNTDWEEFPKEIII